MAALAVFAFSAATLIPMAYFVATGDFTSSSTAPVALAIYPIYMALLALPLPAVVWLIARKRGR